MNAEATTVLGFDFGERRIGVAVGQSITATASPVTIVSAIGGRPDWDTINALIKTWEPDALIVGMPFSADGSRHELAARIERFCRQLKGRYHLPVHTIDERLSSVEAAERQARAGSRESAIDAIAAQVILETWLAEQHSHSKG